MDGTALGISLGLDDGAVSVDGVSLGFEVVTTPSVRDSVIESGSSSSEGAKDGMLLLKLLNGAGRLKVEPGRDTVDGGRPNGGRTGVSFDSDSF